MRARAAALGAAPGVVTAEQLRGRAGLQAMLDGELPYAPMMQTLQYHLVQVAHGRVVFQGEPQWAFSNPLGTAHGGWYATLLDSALGCAVHTTLDASQRYTTAEFGIHLVRAASENSGPLRAIGQVVHARRQLATAEARIVDAAGKVYAHGSTTCLVFAAPSR